MANKLKTTLGPSATSDTLTGLAAGAIVVVASELPVAVDIDLDGADTWKQVWRDTAGAAGGAPVEIRTAGGRLRVRNLAAAANKVVVDEV